MRKDISIRMSLKGAKKTADLLKGTGKEGERLARRFDRMSKSSVAASRKNRAFSRSLESIASRGGLASNALLEMGSAGKVAAVALGGVAAIVSGREIIGAADSMQRLEARLKAVTGSSEAAEAALSFLKTTAKAQSVDVINLADGYNRLLPAVNNGTLSLDQMQRILQLATDNVKAFGLSSSETQGLFLGLSQTFTSGTVTMEDLRQVTDRLPGSLDRIAKASGLTVNEFKKLVATGTLTADQISQAMLTAFAANEGAAKQLANTYDSATTRLKNASRETFARMAESSGLLDAVTGAVNGLAAALENGTIERGLKGIAVAGGVIAGAKIALTMTAIGKAAYGAAGGVTALSAATGRLGLLFKSMNWPMLAIGAVATGLGLLASRTSEAEERQKKHNEALASARMIYQELKTATGERKEELKKESEQLLSNTKLQIDNTKAKIADLVAQQERLAALRNNDNRPTDLDSENFNQSIPLGSEAYASRKQLSLLDKINALNAELDRQQQHLKEYEAVLTEGVVPAVEKTETVITQQSKAVDKHSSSIEKINEQLKDEIKLLGLSEKERTVELARRKAIQGLVKEFKITQQQAIQHYAKEIDQVEALAGSLYQLEQQQQAVKEIEQQRAEQMREHEHVYQEAMDNIQGTLADTFSSIAKDGEEAFKNMFDRIKNLAIDAAAEIAAAMVIRGSIQPTILSGLNQAGGGLGGFGNILGSLGGGGLIDQLGASVGFGYGSDFIGPLQQGAGSLTSTALSSVFGSAGIGATVGSLNVFGGKSTGSTVGGTIGGIAGSFLGPLGTIAGSVIGSAIGGLFGKREGVKASQFASEFGGASSFGSKRLDNKFARSLSGQVNQYLDALQEVSGIAFDGFISGGYNSRKGGAFLQTGTIENPTSKRINFDAESAEETEEAFNKLAAELIQTASIADEELSKALKNLSLEGLSAAEVLDKISVVSGRSAELFDQALATQLLGIKDPVQLAINQEKERFALQLEEANRIGADLNQVEELHAIRMQELLEAQQSTLTQTNDQLSRQLDSLALSNLSPLNPNERYNEAKRQFETINRLSADGDLNARSQLGAISEQFLRESQNYYASSQEFIDDYNRVQQLQQEMKQAFNKEQTTSEALLSEQKMQNSLIRQMSDNLSSLLQRNVEATEELSNNQALEASR